MEGSNIFPFPTEDNPFQHPFPLQYFQQQRRDAFGLDIKVQAKLLLAGNPNRVFKSRNPHTPEAAAPPDPAIEQLEFVERCQLDIPHAAGEAFQKVVVIQNEFPIERLSDVDLNNVATHASRE